MVGCPVERVQPWLLYFELVPDDRLNITEVRGNRLAIRQREVAIFSHAV